jgi:heme-degrading monooxygenase HmoA
MEIVLITFESGLGIEEVDELFQERAGHYREMDGLLQKFYLHDEESGHVGGIYVFDSKESSETLFESDIHASLRDAYEARDVEIETFDVMLPLYESAEFPMSG